MNDLEFLREMFKDTRLHVGIGTISQLGISTSGSVLRGVINLLPENREVVAEITFSDVNDVCFPEINDLVIVVFVDGNPDECFAIKVINNSEEPIPAFAQSGNKVSYSRPGKKFYLGSDAKIGIGRPNIEPTEPLVLGNVLKNGLTALANAFLNNSPIGQCAVGPVYLDPAVRTALTNFLNVYVTTAGTNVVSQIGFTERGV